MITRRREVGQWLVFVAICLLAVAVAYGFLRETVVSKHDCACTQAAPAATALPTG